jgi:hypothetical protein
LLLAAVLVAAVERFAGRVGGRAFTTLFFAAALTVFARLLAG